MKIIKILLTIIIVSIFPLITLNKVKAAGGVSMSEKNLNVTCYQSANNYGYDSSKMSKVDNFSHGNGPITKAKIEGFITSSTINKNRDVIGVSSSKHHLLVEYDGIMLDETNGSKLYADSSKSIYGVEYSGSIGKGALLLQRKNEIFDYVDIAAPVMNYFEDCSKNQFNYIFSSDTYTQEYYRLSFAYETRTKINGSYNYFYNLEVYEFIVLYDDVDIIIRDLSVKPNDLNIDGLNANFIANNNTLINNSITTSGFTIDKNGKDVDVDIYKNGKLVYKDAFDGTTYSSEGCYYVDVTNYLGTYKRTVFYVLSDEKRGYDKYFESPFISGERILDDGMYPVFAKDSKFILKGVDSNTPSLTGYIKNIDTDDTINIVTTNDKQEFVLKPGRYNAVFDMNKNNSGSYFKYDFNFIISNQEISVPSHNYNVLMNRCNLEDLDFKHYEVAYQMTLGGYIYVCFSMDSYDKALEYATNIEARFIEYADDGYFYYKAKDNPNKKDKYLSEAAAYVVAMQYAKSNVEISYFNPLDSVTYTTIDDATVSKLEELNFIKSVRVFPSLEEKNKIINRMPYINNFIFVQVADFDVNEVKAYCKKTGSTIDIAFDVPIYNQLITSSVYTITETNMYGHKIEYDVYFEKENMTITNWDFCIDGETNNISIRHDDMLEGKYEITCDSAILRSLTNDLDDNTIIVIAAPGVYTCEISFLINEISQFELYKKGTYNITVVDRLKNSFRIIINITGKTRYNRLEENSLTLTDLYNAIFINKIDDSDELKLDDSKLIEELKKNVDSKLYTTESFSLYMSEMIKAQAVYDNPDSSQEELDDAVICAKNALLLLKLYIDKTRLKQYIDYIEKLDVNDYTPKSYNPLDDKYLEAIVIYNCDTSTQIEIDEITNLLISKISLLVGRANLTNLSRVVREILNVDTSIYTTKSINELNVVMNDAQTLLKDLNASQNDVDSLCNYLKSKYSSLVLKGNKEQISNLVEIINKLEYEIYTSDTIKTLKTSYDYVVSQVKEDLSQEEIDSLYLLLNKKYDELVVSEKRKELKTLLEEKDLSNKKVKDAYDKLYDMNTSEEEIVRQIEILESNGSNNTLKMVIIISSLLLFSGIIIIVVFTRKRRKNI